MITAVCQKLSGGKTLGATALGFIIQDPEFANAVGWKCPARIFANYHLRYPYTFVKTYADFCAMRNGLFIADELWSWLDARNSNDKQSSFLTGILLSAGKRGVDLLYTTQHHSQIDKRLRNVTDNFIFPLFNEETGVLALNFTDFFLNDMGTLRIDARPVFELYDTHEEVGILEGLEKFKAQRAIRQYNAEKRAEKLGLNLKEY